MQCVAACVLILSWFGQHRSEYDTAHRDALMRQMWTESNYQHCVVNRASGSSFLMQWVGPRKAALHRFAGTNACPSVQSQLDFMDSELRANDRYGAFFAASGPQAFRILRDRYGYGR